MQTMPASSRKHAASRERRGFSISLAGIRHVSDWRFTIGGLRPRYIIAHYRLSARAWHGVGVIAPAQIIG